MILWSFDRARPQGAEGRPQGLKGVVARAEGRGRKMPKGGRKGRPYERIAKE
jgi:hypothetical protein